MDLNSTFTSIKPDVDLSEVPPLNRRRLVAFVNYFLMKNTEFLNSFAVRAEEMILEAEKQLRVTDKRLKLLEEKLMAIQVNPSQAGGSTLSQPTMEQSTVEVAAVPSQVKVNEEQIPVTSVMSNAEPDTQGDATRVTCLIKDDPMFSKYFKMLKVGIVEQAVKLKMASEGVDPQLLDTPDALSPVHHPMTPVDPIQTQDTLESASNDGKDDDFESDDDSISSFSD